ncbi:MAG TPA: matrixin family metalloprotease [Opitutaceae bacterium]|nr:matrixin family metalloprotease [Opitutaceae bacterium]
MSPRGCLLFLGAAVIGATSSRAHVSIGPTWPTGTIPMQLQLDATATSTATFPLEDGAPSWNSIAQAALAEWNPNLTRSRFTSTVSTSTAAQAGDGVTNVIFAGNIYGQFFPSRALAVTLVEPFEDDRDHTRTVEADVLVNREHNWSSYRGNLKTGFTDAFDLRRVLLHEFGHVIGLDHPDRPASAQRVDAIMNSTIGNLESLQADDIAGARFLYNTPFARPVFTTQPASRTVNAGSGASFVVGVNGRSPPQADQFLSFRWYFKAPGAADFELLFTLHRPGNLDFSLAQLVDAGSYFYRVDTPDHTVDSDIVTLTVNPVAPTPATSLANLSTRGIASSGANSLIVGFNVVGPRAKTVLLRSVGPTLTSFNVPGTLLDPRLTLRNQAGATVATSAAIWDQSTDVAAIRDATGRVGAFALAAGSRDAVILASLPPGNYTAQTSSPSGLSGVVVVEAYDADVTPDPASRLTNLSTRGFVDTGANIMIAGFVVRGPGPRNYLIRVVGDTLREAPFRLTGTLDDPYLKIFRGDGALVREFDDWDSPSASQPALRAAFTQVGAFPLTDRQEPAMLVTLPPGNYTAQVSGLDNGGTTIPRGIGLIELYELP